MRRNYEVVLDMDLSLFEHRLDKINLALMSSVEAKEQSVKEYGIGEDINMNLFCWDDSTLRLMLQARPDIQEADHVERFDAFTNVSIIARKGWGVSAFTLISEGWVSTDPLRTKGKSLAESYLDKDSPVKECMTVTHVEDRAVTFVVRPYRYGVPRTVEWEDEIYYPGKTIVRGQNSAYPTMFDRVLTTIEPEELPEDEEAFYDVLSHGILQAGFYCQVF
jgi:hypothetical protein